MITVIMAKNVQYQHSGKWSLNWEAPALQCGLRSYEVTCHFRFPTWHPSATVSIVHMTRGAALHTIMQRIPRLQLWYTRNVRARLLLVDAEAKPAFLRQQKPGDRRAHAMLNVPYWRDHNLSPLKMIRSCHTWQQHGITSAIAAFWEIGRTNVLTGKHPVDKRAQAMPNVLCWRNHNLSPQR